MLEVCIICLGFYIPSPSQAVLVLELAHWLCVCVTQLCPVAQSMGRPGALQKHRAGEFGWFSELNHLAQGSDRQGESGRNS